MRISKAKVAGAENGWEVLPQWAEPTVFDGDDLLVNAGLLALADSLAHVDPVGGLAGRAAVALAPGEGFEWHGLEAIALLSVDGQLAADDGQELDCQAFALDLRQDQDPRAVHLQLQVLEPLRRLPTDDAVAHSEEAIEMVLVPDAQAKAQEMVSDGRMAPALNLSAPFFAVSQNEVFVR